MRVFITGASGWIGSATTDEALAAGHQVIGLARSDASAAALEAKGATVLRGDLDSLDVIRTGAVDADAVIHLANKHDWSNPAESNRAERAAVSTITEALEGSGKPFLFASGVAGLAQGRPSVESDASPFTGPDAMRGGAENLALEFLDRGIEVVSLRFSPTTHGVGDHGFVDVLVKAAVRNGAAGYVGDGTNRWAAVHRSDAAKLNVLALENPSAMPIVHAVAEEGVPTKEIAEAIGRSLGLPVVSVPQADAAEHFGFLGGFFGMDMSSSSTATRETLGWTPTGPTLVEDIDAGAYAQV
ncbi:SDR family oxidoreductase [Curtobacterium sp. Leaf261]|uniref:SDR family oxidoreductase n=1 Tax=Curtobacterium sp. Leaf261 TaxID=1736311 RepID=UPI0006F9208D|nr:SDR family oxidoreductase [Curtobacterium sp. Leaf261]KQO59744.1 3-beta hydroxysteroid dehydrogenase [Curtobacterium sp. Leaf261]